MAPGAQVSHDFCDGYTLRRQPHHIDKLASCAYALTAISG
jgi:hypothetical protein